MAARTRYIALLRGINVGRAKRVAMAELRTLVEGLGFQNVRTLLNSGNVVFDGDVADCADAAIRIEHAVAARTGVVARVLVLAAGDLATIVDEHQLRDVALDHSRLLVTFLFDPADAVRLAPLATQDWTPERLAVGTRAAYLWCPNGILASRLPEAVGRALGTPATARNWATVMKLHALVMGDRSI